MTASFICGITTHLGRYLGLGRIGIELFSISRWATGSAQQSSQTWLKSCHAFAATITTAYLLGRYSLHLLLLTKKLHNLGNTRWWTTVESCSVDGLPKKLMQAERVTLFRAWVTRSCRKGLLIRSKLMYYGLNFEPWPVTRSTSKYTCANAT